MTEHKAGHTASFVNGAAEAPVLFDDISSTWLTYRDLETQTSRWATELGDTRSLVFLYLRNNINSVAVLLGALRAGHAVALLDAQLPTESRSRLEQLYVPEFVVQVSADGRCEIKKNTQSQLPPHADLAILLSTSGSTGDPKFVRLTNANICSNADAIGQALKISDQDVSAGYLPLHYSYGFSVLTSTLAAGGRVLLTDKGFMDRAFWPLMKEQAVSHFPGVPFHFQMMHRLGFKRLGLNSVRTLTQAGGRLDETVKQAAYTFMSEIGGRFHVMYGQTEASPRITTLSHEDFEHCKASVGAALKDGRLLIKDDAGTLVPPGEEGRVFYHGPNVMMGYASCREDLARGDDLGGWLDTGDIGFLDKDGRLTLTGRAGRVGKLYGLRVNLDAIEALARTIEEAAVMQNDNTVVVFHLSSENDKAAENQMLELFKKRFTLPLTAYKFIVLNELPVTDRGKLDYKALGAIL